MKHWQYPFGYRRGRGTHNLFWCFNMNMPVIMTFDNGYYCCDACHQRELDIEDFYNEAHHYIGTVGKPRKENK